MKKILFVLSALGALTIVFTHPNVVAAGCTRGLTLWYSAVLPSLLPFLIFSGILVQTGLFRYLNRIYAPVLGRIFRISDDGCYAVLLGFLCGFPMGAKVVADLVREQHISVKEGEYLLGFCNNVSPAFFLNYVCLLKLGYPSVPWKLVLVFYGLPILYGLVTRPLYHFDSRHAQSGLNAGRCVPCRTARHSSGSRHAQKQAPLHRLTFPMLDACIMDSFATITRLGGYIILFTILVQLLSLLPVSSTALAFLSGALEISCGVDQIAALTLPASIRTAFVCTSAAFGGFCICAQTQSVLDGTPLHVTTWLRGRIFTALLALLLLPLPSVVPALHGCW